MKNIRCVYHLWWTRPKYKCDTFQVFMYVSSSLCRRETILFPTLVSILTVSCATSQNKTSDHYHHVIVCAKSFEVEWSFPVSREHLHLGSMSEQLPPKYVSLERFDTILWEIPGTPLSWYYLAANYEMKANIRKVASEHQIDEGKNLETRRPDYIGLWDSNQMEGFFWLKLADGLCKGVIYSDCASS